MKTSSTNFWFQNIILQPKEAGLLGEVADSKTVARKTRMSPEHLVVPKVRKCSKNTGACCRKTGVILKESPLVKAGTMCATN